MVKLRGDDRCSFIDSYDMLLCLGLVLMEQLFSLAYHFVGCGA